MQPPTDDSGGADGVPPDTDRLDGLHHVTAIASDPQANVDFYSEVLGLRLVKRTVNFDDRHTYHLYYGDEVGTPGTVLTFFPFAGGREGSVGRGQPCATGFVVPPDAVDYWVDRLESSDRVADVDEPRTRFDETVVPFRDHDGQPLELVTGESDIEPWADGPVPAEYAVRGFHGVTLDSLQPDATRRVLELMGYEAVGSEPAESGPAESGPAASGPTGSESDASADERTRFHAPGDRAAAVDVLDRPDGRRGAQGVGTVHHVAFRTPDEERQDAWRERLLDEGLRATEPKDRRYFRSIYYREPGGSLFELATEGPGFTRDEDVDELGSDLKLPPWLEDERAEIERQLPDITTEETPATEPAVDR